MKITAELMEQLRLEEKHLKSKEDEIQAKLNAYYKDPAYDEFFKVQRAWIDASCARTKVTDLIDSLERNEASR